MLLGEHRGWILRIALDKKDEEQHIIVILHVNLKELLESDTPRHSLT